MKKLHYVLGGVALMFIASCRNSTGPTEELPVQQGNNGTYYYHHEIFDQRAQDSVVYDEKLTFPANLRTDTSFVANYQPLDGTHPSIERYSALRNGDLLRIISDPQCFKTPLPIITHRTYLPDSNMVTTPTKANGFEADGSVTMSSEYLGQETVVVGMTPYPCSKVRYDVTVKAASGTGPGALAMSRATMYYWYSPTIGFFAREEGYRTDSSSISQYTRKDYRRTLTNFIR